MKNLQKPMWLMVGILLISSCRTSIEQATTIVDEFTIETVKVISYEVETVTTRKTIGGNANEIDKVKAVPIITRDAVKMGIDKYGQTELFIEKKKPNQVLLPLDEIPQSSLPEVILSHIVGGIGNFYDKNHNLLYTTPIEDTPVDVDFLFAKRANKPDYGQYIKEAEAMGAIITDLGNGTFSTRITKRVLDGNGGGGAARTSEGGNYLDDTYNVTIIDSLRGVAVATAIFDMQDNPLFAMYYNYEESADGELTLNATQQHVFENDPATETEAVIQVNAVYENLTLTEN